MTVLAESPFMLQEDQKMGLKVRRYSGEEKGGTMERKGRREVGRSTVPRKMKCLVERHGS